MKRLVKGFLLALGAIVVVVAVVIVVRTARFAARGERAAPVEQAGLAGEVVDSAALVRFSDAIRVRTITHFDSAADIAEFRKFHAFLQGTFPLVHARMRREIVDSGTLLFTWRGTDTTLAPVLLMGHQDVVPIEPGTERNWKYPPFSGAIADGYVWGRGTLDDKISVMGLLEGAEALLRRGVQPRRSLIFSFGHTEEAGGAAAEITAKLLESRGIRPWFVMDEGGAIGERMVPGVSGRVALVGVAEKGYLSVQITARGAGGHSSMPPREGAVGILAEAVNKVQGAPLPSRLGDATLAMFEALGPSMPYSRQLVMANLWLFEPLVKSTLARTPPGNAAVRTTTAVTMLNAGIKDNVLPTTATAVANFRLLPGDSVRWVISRLESIIDDDRVTVKPLAGMDREASGVSPSDSEGFKVISRTIREVFPGSNVSPYLVMAGTDARHFERVSPNVYRFAPLVIEPGGVLLAHGTNERIGVANYLTAVRFYTRLIENAVR